MWVLVATTPPKTKFSFWFFSLDNKTNLKQHLNSPLQIVVKSKKKWAISICNNRACTYSYAIECGWPVEYLLYAFLWHFNKIGKILVFPWRQICMVYIWCVSRSRVAARALNFIVLDQMFVLRIKWSRLHDFLKTNPFSFHNKTKRQKHNCTEYSNLIWFLNENS